MQFLKEVLLLPALNNRDEKVIGGLACLMSEIGQAVSIGSTWCTALILILFDYFFESVFYTPLRFKHECMSDPVLIKLLTGNEYRYENWYPNNCGCLSPIIGTRMEKENIECMLL